MHPDPFKEYIKEAEPDKNTRTTAVFFIKYLRTLGFDAKGSTIVFGRSDAAAVSADEQMN